MNFSIGYDIGPFGIILLVLLAVPAGIVLYSFFLASKRAHDDVVENEDDAPIA